VGLDPNKIGFGQMVSTLNSRARFHFILSVATLISQVGVFALGVSLDLDMERVLMMGLVWF